MTGLARRQSMAVMLMMSAAMIVAPGCSMLSTDSRGSGAGSAKSAGAYYTGAYPDLFGELLGKSRPEVRARIDSAFQILFFGNADTERVYYPVGSDMAYITDVANNDVRTEGMSYGMMIAVQMDRKDVFDRLWKWAKTFMQFSDGPSGGYFAWHCRTDGTRMDSTAASDGEEWFVTSLFFASARWNDGEGIYDYRGEAQKILRTMLHKESEPGHGNVTNMFNAQEHLVAFVPKLQGNLFTDPSYQLPHYYELWGRWAERDNGFWCTAASASRRLLRRVADSTTGLSPDYSTYDGAALTSRPGGHGDFRFDAWRVAMNVAIDWLWFAADEWQVTQSNRLLDFFHAQGVAVHGNQFTLAGKKLSDSHSTGLVAMNAVAALASTREHRKAFLEELWKAAVPTGFYRYYDGMLYMMALLQLSGNFRIYDPTGRTISGCP